MYEKIYIVLITVICLIELIFAIWSSVRLDRTRKQLASCLSELERYRADEHRASESIEPVADGIDRITKSIGSAIDSLRQSEARINEQRSSIEQLRERLKALQEFEHRIRSIYDNDIIH